MTDQCLVSHVLSLSTANGGQPRTPSVIIYLQAINACLLAKLNSLQEVPLPLFGLLTRGVYRVPPRLFPIKLVSVAL